MDELHKSHGRFLFMYIAIPACSILFAFICAKFFHFLPPFWLIGAVICLCPLVCSAMRLKLWKKRDTLFSPEELESRPVRIFFSAIPVEISFSLIALGFLLFG